MANGKTDITEIDLTKIDVNLSDYLSDIRPYNGFIKCNSPYIGGLLNNVYIKDFTPISENKIVKVYNGNVYSVDNASLWKNDERIYIFPTSIHNKVYKIKKEKYTDPFIVEMKNQLIINYSPVGSGRTYTFSVPYESDLAYDYIIDNGQLILTLAPRTDVSYSSWKSRIKSYSFDTGKQTYTSGVVFCNSFHSLTDIDTMVSNHFPNAQTFVQYDASGLVIEGKHPPVVVYKTENGILYSSGNSMKVINGTCFEDHWNKGEKLKTNTPFSTLYYNKYISGISVNSSLITTDVDRIIRVSSDSIVYQDTSGVAYKLSLEESDSLDFYFDEDYIYFNTPEYNNTFDLKNERMFCRSYDFNDRLVPIGDTGKKGLFVSSWHSNAQVYNYPDFATLYPQTYGVLGQDYKTWDISEVEPIDIFEPIVDGGVAYYKKTITFGTSVSESKNPQLEDTVYPIEDNGNILYNTPLDMVIKSTYANERIGNINGNSYILAKSQKQTNVLGYYEYTMSELSNLFLVQGSFYGVSDRFIFSVSIDNSIVSVDKVVANKLDLEFIGAFSNYALFYSKLDKSLYTFTGDGNISKTKEVYRINEVYSTYCDPSRLTMIFSTDIGVVVIYQDQIFLLDYGKIENIYYDSNSYILDNHAISFSKLEGFSANDVKLQTEFYGAGNCIKSINDCVYIRIADNGKTNGKIKISSYCLAEKTAEQTEKEIPLNNFDKLTGSMLIRYQPKFQSGVGFSVKIESTNPIVSLHISHQVEAVQNSKVNL